MKNAVNSNEKDEFDEQNDSEMKNSKIGLIPKKTSLKRLKEENKASITNAEIVLNQYAAWKNIKRKEKENIQSQIENIKKKHYCKDYNVPFIIMPEIPNQFEYCIKVEKEFRKNQNIDGDIDSEFFIINNHPGDVGHWDTTHVKSAIKNEQYNIKSSGADLSCGAYTLINIIKSNQYFLNLPTVQAVVEEVLFDNKKLDKYTDVNATASSIVRKFLSTAIELGSTAELNSIAKKDIQLSLERINELGNELTDQDIKYVCLALDLPLYQLKAFQIQETDLSQIKENILDNLIKNRLRNNERGRDFEKENKEELKQLKSFCEEKGIGFKNAHESILHNRIMPNEKNKDMSFPEIIQNKIFKTPDSFVKEIQENLKKSHIAKAQQRLEEGKNCYINTLAIIQSKRAFFAEKEDYRNIKTCLIELSCICFEQAKKELNFVKFSDLIIETLIYNNAAWVVNNKFTNGNTKKRDFLFKDFSFKIHDIFLKRINKKVSKKKFLENLESYHKKIKLIGSGVEEKVKEINKIDFNEVHNKEKLIHRAEQVFLIYDFITDNIKALLVNAFKDCEKILGKPKFSYSVICFGSLAKQLATNYSDIEFAILLDECEKCDLKDNSCVDCNKKVEYLKQLSYLFAMSVINFKQTTIHKKMLNEKTDLDDILERGIQLDPGDKTPIKDKNYMLIQTPKKMIAKYMCDEAYKIDPLLPPELMRANHLYGDKEITEKYKNEIINFFSTIENTQPKALKRARKLLEDDLLKYEQNKPELILKSPNVKQEIYRPFTALLEGFALYCGEFNCDIPTFKYIDILLSKEKFGFDKEIADDFKIALGIALEFRLCTYHNYHKKKDEMHLLKINFDFLKRSLNLKETLFQFSKEEAILFDKLCLTKNRFCCFLRKILDSSHTEELFLKDFFNQPQSNTDQRYNIEEKIFRFIQMLQELIETIGSKNELVTIMEKITSEAQATNFNVNEAQNYIIKFSIPLLSELSTKSILFEISKCDLLITNPFYCYKIIEGMLNQVKIIDSGSQVTKILNCVYYFCTAFKEFKKDLLKILNINLIEDFFKKPGLQQILKNICPQESMLDLEKIKKLFIDGLKTFQLEDGNELKSIIGNEQIPFGSETLEQLVEKLKVFHSERNYKEQAVVYSKIAWIYFKENRFIDAIAFYNFALGALKKWTNSELKSSQLNSEFILESSNLKQKLQLGITIVENSYLTSIGKDFKLNSYSYEKTYHLHRKCLSTLRKQVEKDIQSNSISIKEIYKNISSAIKKFVVLLVNESIQILGEPPCAYAIIGLGSLARNEATPYSDFEFAILVNNLSCKSYFKQLTELINIKVLNLGETSPKIAYINPEIFSFTYDYERNPVQKGFAFDSRDPTGCKIPLGNHHLNIPSEEKFDLIQTPHTMLQYQSNQWFETRKNKTLPTILQSITFITGEIKLVNQYQTLLHEFLAPWEKKRRAKQLLESDIWRFEPRVGIREKTGRIYPVKYDLYRLPNLIFESLSSFFLIEATNTIDRIDTLASIGLLNPRAVIRLKGCCSKISRLRLKNYINAQEQSDNLIIDMHDQEGLNELFEIYRVLIYLFDCSYAFSVNNNIHYFKTYDFQADQSLADIRIYEKLLDEDTVIQKCKEMINNIPKDLDKNTYSRRYVVIANRLGLAYLHQDKLKEAEQVFKKAIEWDVDNNPALIVNYALVLDEFGRYDEAIIQFKTAKKMMQDPKSISTTMTFADKEYSISELYTLYGMTLKRSGNYTKALKYLRKAVESEKKKFSNLETSSLYRYQNNLAVGLTSVGELEEGLQLCNKGLEEAKKRLGNFHPAIARGLYNKAQILFMQGKYQEALECNKKTLEIYDINEDVNHKGSMAHYLVDLAITYIELEEKNAALESLEKALKINLEIYGKDHRMTIVNYLNLLRVYTDLKKWNSAIEIFNNLSELSCLKKDLDLKARSLALISNTYIQWGDYQNKDKKNKDRKKVYYEKALDYINEAICIGEELLMKEPYGKHVVQLAHYLNVKGQSCFNLNDFELSEICHKDSLDRLKAFFKDAIHADMVTANLNLGKIYLQKFYGNKDLRKALNYLAEALKIQKKLGIMGKNRSLFQIHECIGYAYYWLREFDDALDHIVKSRKIALQFHLKIEESSQKLFEAIVKRENNDPQPLVWSYGRQHLNRKAKMKREIVSQHSLSRTYTSQKLNKKLNQKLKVEINEIEIDEIAGKNKKSMI